MIFLKRLSVLLLLTPFTQAADIVEVETSAIAPVRTGFFRITLTPTELFGADGAATVARGFDANEELAWQLYVPPTYDPLKPAGAIVYVSPRSSAGPRRSWNDVLGDRNMIWIGALNASDEVPVARRMILAMFAPMVLQRDYSIDPARVYIAGFSGGGTIASRVAAMSPNVFKGGIFVSGALFWEKGTPPLVDTIRGQRYVFISGSRDTDMGGTEYAHGKFLDAGVTNSKLMIIPNLGYALPDSINFARAIDYLDSRDAG